MTEGKLDVDRLALAGYAHKRAADDERKAIHKCQWVRGICAEDIAARYDRLTAEHAPSRPPERAESNGTDDIAVANFLMSHDHDGPHDPCGGEGYCEVQSLAKMVAAALPEEDYR